MSSSFWRRIFALVPLLLAAKSGFAMPCGEYRLANSPWTPLPSKILSLGYSTEELQIRLSRDCLTELTTSFKKPILTFRYPLTHVLLSFHIHGASIFSKELGEASRGTPDYPMSRSHFFDLRRAPNFDELVIHVRSETALVIPITFGATEDVIASRESDGWLLALHYGLLGMFVLFCVAIFAVQRRRIFLSGALYATGILLVLSAINWIPQTFMPFLPYSLRIALVPISAGFYFAGVGALFWVLARSSRTGSPSRISRRIGRVFLFSGFAQSFAAVFLKYQISIAVAHLLLIVMTVVVIGVLIYARVRRRSEWKPAIVALPVSLGLCLISLRALGLNLNFPIINLVPQITANISVVICGFFMVQELILQIREHYEFVERAQSVVHDIRSPLSTIRVINGLERHLSTEGREVLGDAVTRMSNLVDDILKETTDSAMPMNRMSKAALGTQLDRITREFQLKCRNAGLGFSSEFDLCGNSDNYWVSLSPQAFDRSVRNLLENAIQATEEGASIELQVTYRNGQVNVNVRDSGHGFPAELLDRIGKERITTKKDGHGIGLTTLSTLAAQAGGKVSYRNRNTGGAEVELVLPTAGI